MVRDSASAEDLAQEVFLRVYRARKDYAPSAKFTTWMFRIATNLALNSQPRWPLSATRGFRSTSRPNTAKSEHAALEIADSAAGYRAAN